ncbi:uncharacterized protein LOC128884412 isoform X2 [Hylaeus volcanicus]|uniref:uncharacterized protein LOC128884412 isoform X2 n=1 Tax=Hylaeus volcanicus TaxID=313075 RepID=UPI0023B7DB98|nr:uncharacterized protein LOC128884412 isoform X2 [Hylaeus volcanicus]
MSCLKPVTQSAPYGSLRLKRQRPTIISEDGLAESTGDSKSLVKVSQCSSNLADILPAVIPKVCPTQLPNIDQACFKEKRRKGSSYLSDTADSMSPILCEKDHKVPCESFTTNHVKAPKKPLLKNASLKTSSNVSVKKENDDENECKSSHSDSSDDEDNLYKCVVSTRESQRDTKQQLIAKLLCRWWYVMDPWPPENYDYDAELARRKYKVVPLHQWEAADDVDSQGFTKVYPLPYFLVYRDPNGRPVDVRPLKGKPCYSSMKTLSQLELTQLLYDAIKNQLSKLEMSPYANTEGDTIERLKNELQDELKVLALSLKKIHKDSNKPCN